MSDLTKLDGLVVAATNNRAIDGRGEVLKLAHTRGSRDWSRPFSFEDIWD